MDDIAFYKQLDDVSDHSALQLDVSLIQEWMDEVLEVEFDQNDMHDHLQEAKSTCSLSIGYVRIWSTVWLKNGHHTRQGLCHGEQPCCNASNTASLNGTVHRY